MFVSKIEISAYFRRRNKIVNFNKPKEWTIDEYPWSTDTQDVKASISTPQV